MNKAFSSFTWYDDPDTRSPLAALYLNKINAGLDTVDDRVITLDTTKANQSDLNQSLKSVAYNSTTGVWTFTSWNGTVQTFDQNVEKIPVSFSMSPQGVITMTTSDGTSYTADVAELIKTYTFSDTTMIDFTVTTDASGNKTVTATIPDGSITDSKLQSGYLASVTQQATLASQSATAASSSANDADYDAKLARSYAVGGSGIREGENTDNAKYYKEQAEAIVGNTGHVIQHDTTTLAARTNLRFTGGTVTDNAQADATIVDLNLSISDTEWSAIVTALA